MEYVLFSIVTNTLVWYVKYAKQLIYTVNVIHFTKMTFLLSSSEI